MRKSTIVLIVTGSILVFFIILVLLGLKFKTGAFSQETIDAIDSKKWSFTKGVINGAEEVRIYSKNTTCWLMIHGYASTPQDFSNLIPVIDKKFNETIIVPRLYGHGELPSKVLNLSFPDWYRQVEKEYQSLEKSCEKINLVGFSFGGALSLKLAENYEINNIYLVSPYLKIRYKPYHIFSKEKYISLIADSVIFSVKYEVAQLNSPEGKKEYIGYYSFPLPPLKHSFDDIGKVRSDLDKVNSSGILILHSKNDDSIDIESSEIINSSVNIENKELIIYKRSNHVLLMDYDKGDVLARIVSFEENSR